MGGTSLEVSNISFWFLSFLRYVIEPLAWEYSVSVSHMRHKEPGILWKRWCQCFFTFHSQSPGWCPWWEFEPKAFAIKIVHFLGPSVLYCLCKPRKMAAGGGPSFKLILLDELPTLLRLAYPYSLVHLVESQLLANSLNWEYLSCYVH